MNSIHFNLLKAEERTKMATNTTTVVHDTYYV